MQFERFLLVLCVLFVAKTKAFTIGLPEYVHNSQEQQQFEQSYKALYSGIGVKVSFAYLPFTRMQLMIEDQQLDAIAYHSATQYPPKSNLIRIPEPLTQVSLVAACLEQCTVNAYSRVVIVKEAIFASQYCKKLALTCVPVSNPESALKAIQSGLADIYMMQWSPHIAEPCLTEQGYKLYPIANTKTDVYHYIAPHHRQMSEQLADTLRQLKKVTQPKMNEDCLASFGPEIWI
ncbi:hypothetical protein P2G88_12615 [Aliiglaciecola sp. CAU 1673]|uniref:hypothetical protein n=1 Tax=Aliiglaciecola sp. CAU 1673 TaxID=3032595 RepID=UPI0023DA6824|nr:hypothetical protein [Aliiglaciecola sp. CAU 1673]MDF2179095.1 hypothetical protein [Aliiglaciecola sp. CAU 1673]